MRTISNNEYISYANNDQAKLFFALTEQLKVPLLQISRSAELAHLSTSKKRLKDIEDIADATMQLVDSYSLYIQLHEAGHNLRLVPVSLSALLSDTAHKIDKIAASKNCDIELHIAGRYGPIMAHPAGLATAFMNIGQALIDVQTQKTFTKRPIIKLAAHRTKNGISAGLFSDVNGLNNAMFRSAKNLYGISRQPLASISAHNGAGVFIADSLLETMSSGLRVARHQKLTGLAATFTPSQQMALV